MCALDSFLSLTAFEYVQFVLFVVVAAFLAYTCVDHIRKFMTEEVSHT